MSVEAPGHALIGMEFEIVPGSTFAVIGFNPETRQVRIRSLPLSVYGADWYIELHSFETVFDMAAWVVIGPNLCVECDTHPTAKDDYLCHWCRYNQAWRELLTHD